MIKAIIVEDDKTAQKILSGNLKDKYPEIELVTTIDNYNEAVKYLEKNTVDIVFLDVLIKGGTGINILKALEVRNFETIFVTAHENYAIDALNNDVSYYLLKPLRKDDFVKAVDIVLRKIQQKSTDVFIKIANKGTYTTISVSDIYYFHSDGAYTLIYTSNGKILSSKNLGYFEKLVPETIFKRCHHSYLVNINQVKQLKKGKNGSVLMSDGTDIPISQRKMSSFSASFD
ncbi:MAG: LytTR family DNA-binding domain-containing protein [Crocinitomicaceae bacterium]|nr:LytTR family DNA-binding domain-containing protein [Crocinitomicaceae bacterium]